MHGSPKTNIALKKKTKDTKLYKEQTKIWERQALDADTPQSRASFSFLTRRTVGMVESLYEGLLHRDRWY
jgi:hypothetical protein